MHVRMHETREVLWCDGEVAQNLKNRDRFGDFLVQPGTVEADTSVQNCMMNGREGAADILIESVVEGDGCGKPTHWLIGHSLLASFAFDQDVLNDLDSG